MSEHIEHDPVETDETPETIEDGTESLEDFDAFWSARKRKAKTTTIMGQRVELPPSLPLQFQLEVQKVARSESEDDVRKLVAILFGQDPVDAWAAAGMDMEQFQVLLAWAPQVIAGQDVTLAQVADLIAERKAGGKGKAPRRRRS